MKLTINLDINKAKTGLSLAYLGKNVKSMTNEEIIELFIKTNKKYGVVEKEN